MHWVRIRIEIRYIFQNAQVTSNKMVHKKRHHFLAQFSLPFHMVCSVLLRVSASKIIEYVAPMAGDVNGDFDLLLSR